MGKICSFARAFNAEIKVSLPTIQAWEVVLAPLFIALGLLSSLLIKDLQQRPVFRLTIGLRVLGGLAFMSIYLFYYAGGDTIAYYDSAVPVVNLLFKNPTQWLAFMFEGYSPEGMSRFTADTGYPLGYIVRETDTLTVVKVLSLVLIPAFKSFLLGTLLLGLLATYGPWKLYHTLLKIAPGSETQAAWAVLFFPSVIFWGCGISKDTITYSATCLLVHFIYEQLICKRYKLSLFLLAAVAFYLVLQIKPYILLVLVPGGTLWFFFHRLQKVKNRFIKWSLAPIVIGLSTIALGVLITQFEAALGEYSFDRIINKAIVTQEDLTREVYGGNSFNIGTIEPTWNGVFQKFPIATFYGFFGPTLVHVQNPVSLIAALENTFLLGLTIWLLIRQSPVKTFTYISAHPFLIFCLSFSIMLAFSIGLTTANFGALVRFKIPLIPFFVSFLLLQVTRRPIHD